MPAEVRVGHIKIANIKDGREREERYKRYEFERSIALKPVSQPNQNVNRRFTRRLSPLISLPREIFHLVKVRRRSGAAKPPAAAPKRRLACAEREMTGRNNQVSRSELFATE